MLCIVSFILVYMHNVWAAPMCLTHTTCMHLQVAGSIAGGHLANDDSGRLWQWVLENTHSPEAFHASWPFRDFLTVTQMGPYKESSAAVFNDIAKRGTGEALIIAAITRAAGHMGSMVATATLTVAF